MRVVDTYFHKGRETLTRKYKTELEEVYQVIGSVDLNKFKTKVSKEKTMTGKLLYSPIELNKEFKKKFEMNGWKNVRYKIKLVKGAFREMDFVKNKLGVEVQFGKYAFMAYNVSAKMTIFHNLKIIDAGVEIVPMKKMADQMSTGVSFFEQIKWDLETRGVADIDIPVVVMGIN